ncbi:DEAD-like helicase [Pandoravirus kuranda]|uniref:DEAD-like helicase n=1 Tax=Pandoravirus kuranda TaxID=3019033 RepID=A0AA95EET3_9VIRU|nr:DEAD-like helicase [Pandoravirus kuranda]
MRINLIGNDNDGDRGGDGDQRPDGATHPVASPHVDLLAVATDAAQPALGPIATDSVPDCFGDAAPVSPAVQMRAAPAPIVDSERDQRDRLFGANQQIESDGESTKSDDMGCAENDNNVGDGPNENDTKGRLDPCESIETHESETQCKEVDDQSRDSDGDGSGQESDGEGDQEEEEHRRVSSDRDERVEGESKDKTIRGDSSDDRGNDSDDSGDEYRDGSDGGGDGDGGGDDDDDSEYGEDSDESDDRVNGANDEKDGHRAKSAQRSSADQRDQTWARARVPDSQRVPLDEALAVKARTGTLTVSDLTDVDVTTALRLATIEAARPVVQQWWGHPLRGLPMVAGPDPAAPYALLPHQVDAVTWMRGREAAEPGRVYGLRGGVLSMRMGLGKTPTALALALTAPRGDMPTLVVCSRSVLKEWHTSGVAKFFGAVDAAGAPVVRALYLHSDYMSAAAMRAIDRQALSRYDFVLTTYDVCAAECRRGQYDEDCLERGPKGRITVVHTRARARADRPDLVGPAVLYGTCWERVICDESQRFANPTTGIYRAMMALYGRYKWCLTGTPIRNSHTDIWAQLRFVGYTGIASRAVWKRDGPTFYTRHRLTEAVLVVGHQDHGTEVAGAERATPASMPLSPASTAATRSTPAVPALPPLLHREVVVTLSPPERATYNAVQGLARSALNDVRARASNFACVLSMFTRLRQVAIGAHIMTVGEDTTTRDTIMRVLRRADDAAAAVADPVARGDPGSRPTAATPSSTMGMTLGSCRIPNDQHAATTTATITATTTTQPAPSPNLNRALSLSTMGGASPTPPSRQHGGVVTVTTVSRPRYPGAPVTTETTTTTTAATVSNTSGSTLSARGEPGADVLRIPMRRRLPQSMRPDARPAHSSTRTTPPVVEILDEGDPTEVAADDARESGMGLAMWCLSRRSRAGTRSAKMRAVTRILGQMPADEKALVFSSFAAALDLVADAVAERLPQMRVVQIDGDTRKADRDNMLHAFRAPHGPRVLLMTYKVGAEGINLPEANHCLFLDPWWTSAVQEQAYSRCWRVGQKRPVTVYNIMAAGTAEQRVVDVCREKSATAATYMASSAAARRAAATASRRGGEATLDLATLSRIIG